VAGSGVPRLGYAIVPVCLEGLVTHLEKELHEMKVRHGDQLIIVEGTKKNYAVMIGVISAVVAILQLVGGMIFGVANQYATKEYVDTRTIEDPASIEYVEARIQSVVDRDAPYLKDKEYLFHRIEFLESALDKILLELKEINRAVSENHPRARRSRGP